MDSLSAAPAGMSLLVDPAVIHLPSTSLEGGLVDSPMSDDHYPDDPALGMSDEVVYSDVLDF